MDKDGVGVIRGVTSHFVVVIMSYSVLYRLMQYCEMVIDRDVDDLSKVP